MRPTIDEQLAGADRLLGLVETDEQLSPGSVELVRNARRLIGRIAGSWSTALPFLVEDNARLAELLDVEPDESVPTDLTSAAARNEERRAELANRIRELPSDAQGRATRSEIGRYLRGRVAADPT
ncbi:hypothetical protein [Rhodococcus sp. NPDC057529]|uniref:hypothetical protein n=1 Tax=Rhodococcus sp. NPDC057529 TaxID=3346158 RepID=UPI00366A871C